MELKRTFDILSQKANQIPDQIALNSKKGGEWISYSYSQYLEKSRQIAKGLLALGIKKGDKIASLSNNRPEWNFIDMAITMVGATHVPLYPNYSSEDLKYIIEQADVRLVFVFNKLVYSVLKTISAGIIPAENIYSFELQTDIPNLSNIIEIGKSIEDQQLEKRLAEITSDDLASIYFTSGTGGRPKGVMVSHNNIVKIVVSMTEIYYLKNGDKVLSYLPLSHSYESAHNYMYQYAGASIFYVESISTVSQNLKEVKPVMFLGVPLLLERIVNDALKTSELKNRFKRRLHNWAYNLALSYSFERENNWFYKLNIGIARKLVYKDWKNEMGGRLKMISAGGAALPENIFRLFWAMDITILEIYGTTETYAISVNSLQYGMRIGTVGIPERGVQVKIDKDGEILSKSPYNFIGYYKLPELTNEVIDQDGWFHTGDLGEWVEGKFLKITGRKKDVFKTSSGIFISPNEVEKQLKESEYIQQVMILGKDKNFLSALIIPDFNLLEKYSVENGIPFLNKKDLLLQPEIKKIFVRIIEEFNKKRWQTEIIGRFELLADDWTIAGGELTPTMKLKRNFVLAKYAELISSFYS